VTPAEVVARIRAHGADLLLMPDGWRLAIDRRSLVPQDLAAEAKAHAAEIREFLKSQGDVPVSATCAMLATFETPAHTNSCAKLPTFAKCARFRENVGIGPLSRHGRLCRICLTIGLVRLIGDVETCDACLHGLMGDETSSDAQDANADV
jgi:hypothetical protein